MGQCRSLAIGGGSGEGFGGGLSYLYILIAELIHFRVNKVHLLIKTLFEVERWISSLRYALVDYDKL